MTQACGFVPGLDFISLAFFLGEGMGGGVGGGGGGGGLGV